MLCLRSYIACHALFSQISLVQSLKFFDISSLPFWPYTALSFLTETARLACIYCGVTLRTYLLLALHRSAPSAYNARNARVLIVSSKNYLLQKRPENLLELCPHKNEILVAQRCYLWRDHYAQPASATHACVYFSRFL